VRAFTPTRCTGRHSQSPSCSPPRCATTDLAVPARCASSRPRTVPPGSRGPN
jgi:hypothetical protein